MCECKQSYYCSNSCREKHILKLQVLYPQEDWKSQRQGYANSSSLWSIIKGWKSSLNQDKISDTLWSPCKHGKAYEPVALKYLSFRGMKIKHCGSVAHDNNLIRASPDGLMVWKNKLTNIEIKCPVNPNNMTSKSMIYYHQYHAAAQCCKSEKILFARFLFKEEFDKWEYDKGFPPGYWGFNCEAFGYFTNRYRTEFKLFRKGDPIPRDLSTYAVKFNLEKINEEWFDPIDVITPNLRSIKEFVTDLRTRRKPKLRKLIDIRTYLKHFTEIDKIFIDNFFQNLDEPVEIDEEMTKWLGFKTKQSLYRIIKNNFPDAEYLTLDKKKLYKLTKDQFKKLCMNINTDRGIEIRKYYLKIEEEITKLLSDI